MKLLMENWKKFINESTFAEKAEKAKEIYAQYWEKADPYAEPGEELPPDIELDGSEGAMQVGFALSHLKLLLADKEDPSEEEIIKAIHDGWDEGSYEYMNLQGRDDD
tara:strand:+ start:110 stop:430 length:321 start_codon:yes stop_codon:yes gene_type:complete